MELLYEITRTSSSDSMGRILVSLLLPRGNFIEGGLGSEASKWLQQFDGAISNGQLVPLQSKQIIDLPPPTLGQEMAFSCQGEFHRWVHDRFISARLMQQEGFSKIRVFKPTESSIPEYSSYHLDTDELRISRKTDSLFMEAIR
jgi:hypothetical protein